MIAYKILAQAPVEVLQPGIPLQYPWCLQPCTIDQIMLLTGQGFTVVTDEEYAAYLASVQPEYDAWLVSMPFMLQLSSSDQFITSRKYPNYDTIWGVNPFVIIPVETGTYYCYYNGSSSYSNAPKTHWVALFKNEDIVPESIRALDSTKANMNFIDTTEASVYCNGTDQVSVRVSCDNTGSLTIGARTFRLTKTGD